MAGDPPSERRASTISGTPLDWGGFEEALFDELLRALVVLADDPSQPRFYALALHGVYRERDGLLGLPRLAAAAVDGAPPPTGDFSNERYDPAEFRYPELPLRDGPLAILEESLTREAMRGSPEHWQATEARYSDVLVRVARRLAEVAVTTLRVTEEFVGYWYDEEGGPALAARSIPARVFARLFPMQVEADEERRRVAAMPPRTRAEFLVSRFGAFDGISTEDAQRQLLELGGEALEALVGKLSDPRHGWAAAMVLGQLGIARPDVLDALRERAGEMWCAMALGMLGDRAWLIERGQQIAIWGLCAPFKSVAHGRAARSLAYEPLETWLESAADAGRLAVEEELAPGSSYARIGAGDVGEALRGLGSAHAVIRWHAAAVLGERGLGKEAGTRILPALAERLGDPHAVVRRISVLSLSYWRSPKYRGAIERLRDDPDEVVRRVVRHVAGA